MVLLLQVDPAFILSVYFFNFGTFNPPYVATDVSFFKHHGKKMRRSQVPVKPQPFHLI